MDEEADRRLTDAVANIQKKWGKQALQKRRYQPPAASPTGFEPIDAFLPTGGLPVGRITELTGRPTSGMVTVTLKIIAHIQHRQPIIYIDIDGNFDPGYADRCGVQLDELILVRPHSWTQALDILQDFVRLPYAGVLIVDLPADFDQLPHYYQTLQKRLTKLIHVLNRSACILLILRPQQIQGQWMGNQIPIDQLPAALPYTTLRLYFQRKAWLYRREDIRGYDINLTVIKNKLGAAGQTQQIQITFDHMVQGDGS